MKFFKRALPLFLCAVACASAFAGCAAGKSTQLGTPKPAQPLVGGGEASDSVAAGARAFAAKFAPAALKDAELGKNYAVSPVSAYMALVVAAACTKGQTQEEIVSALGVDYRTLESGFSDFFRTVVKDEKDDLGEQAGLVTPVNSVWIDEHVQPKQDCLQTLADDYYSYSYAADFLNDNKNANLVVRNFVKEQTHEMIDVDFKLSEETLLVILNTLYLKDVWNDAGKELSLTQEEHSFVNADGTTAQKQLLEGYYRAGRVHETKTYSTFFTTTNMGLKIKFVLPKQGVAPKEVFTEKTLAEVNALSDYNEVNRKKKEEYYTRCIFPEYTASYDEQIAEALKENFGINTIFQRLSADFSALSDEQMFCSQVRHVTKLDVNRKGVEGSAVTIMGISGSSAPNEYKRVYEDFVVDRAFGFLLTDSNDTVLFSGIVNKV